MRIYLKIEPILAAGFKVNSIKMLELPLGVGAYCTVDGVYTDQNRGVTERPSLPQGVKPEWVSYYSFVEYMPDIPKRRRGMYRSGTAVLVANKHRDQPYCIKITSGSISEAQSLFQLFAAGLIFPTPSDDWEASQIERPLRSVRDLLKEAWLILRCKAAITLTNLRQELGKV